MADRVHPVMKEQEPTDTTNYPTNAIEHHQDSASKPKAGTYVIQIPKDQIYRVPPPQNAHLFESYSRRGSRSRGSCCCRCLVWSVAVLLLTVIALAVAAAILYFVFRPKLPSYSIENMRINDFHNMSALSPEFDITVKANNPNNKISIYYEDGSDIVASYSNVVLSRGSWPVFRQPRKNVTLFSTILKGSGLRLSKNLQNGLAEQQRKGQVPLQIHVKVPVKLKFGLVKSWKIDVKVNCDLVVDKMAENAKIVSKKCKSKVDIC